jgi:hypothetical protein
MHKYVSLLGLQDEEGRTELGKLNVFLFVGFKVLTAKIRRKVYLSGGKGGSGGHPGIYSKKFMCQPNLSPCIPTEGTH